MNPDDMGHLTTLGLIVCRARVGGWIAYGRTDHAYAEASSPDRETAIEQCAGELARHERDAMLVEIDELLARS